MSNRLKITLPDPTLAQLRALAQRREEPLARVAAQIITTALADEDGSALGPGDPSSR